MANIEGRNPIIEALRSDRPIDKLMISNTSKEGSIKKIIGMAKEKNVVIQYVDKHKLDEISTSHSHQGVIAVVSDYKYYELEDLLAIARERGEDPFFIILDEITDPHNLGTIIRTADAVGAHGVIIPKRRSVHITSVVAKASAGAVEYVPVCKVTNIANTIKQLKKEGLWIAAADMDGGVFYEQDLTGPLALVIGSEGFGVSRLVKQNCDFVVKMPMIGNVSSLNAADAVGAHGVIIPKRRSVHITSVVAKASAGAVEYVPVCKVTNIANTIKQLKKEGLWIAAADMDGGVFYEQDLTGPLALVIGSEGFGVSRLVKQNCDFVVKMPMIGNVSSLNASVAGGILLYEIFRQRMKRD